MRMKKVFYRENEVKELLFNEKENKLINVKTNEPVRVCHNGHGRKAFVELDIYGRTLKLKLKHLLVDGRYRVDFFMFGYEKTVSNCSHTKGHKMTLIFEDQTNTSCCTQCGVVFTSDRILEATAENYVDAIHQLRVIRASLISKGVPLVLNGLSIDEINQQLRLMNSLSSKKHNPFKQEARVKEPK